MNTLINGFKLTRLLAYVTPFVLLCLRSSKINLPKAQRAYQYLTVLVALFYCVPAMIWVDRVAVGLVRGLNWLSSLAMMVPVVGKVLSWFTGYLNAGIGVQMFANTMLMAGFCGVKHTTLQLCKKLHNSFPSLYTILLDWFYEKRVDEEHPCLREHCRQLRTLIRVFYVTFIVIAGVDMALTMDGINTVTQAFPVYPVFGVIILGECAFFLGGNTQKEREEEDEQNNPKGRVDANFEKLRTALEGLFGDRLLYNDEHAGFTQNAQNDDEDPLAELSTAPDSLKQITGFYFQHLCSEGLKLEMDYVHAALNLMQGKSVLFNNPFYRDVTPYIMLPIQHHLINHARVLVISGRTGSDDDVYTWLKTSIRQACGLENLWSVEFLGQQQHDSEATMPDIGVLSFNDLYNLNLQKDYQAFFECVSLVMILEPSNLLGTGQIGLRSVCQQCEKTGKQITYAAFDRNCDGLVDSLSHTLRQSIVEVMASPLPRCKYYQMFWAAEGNGIATRILPNVSQFLGFGTELGVVGLRHHVKRIYWYGGSKLPLVDLRWIAAQYTSALCGYAECPVEQNILSEKFSYIDGIWQAGHHRDAFVVVEDEFCNMFEMARLFAARAEGIGFINILSNNYMLRDYMRANPKLFESDPKAIPSFSPDFARTQRNLALRLLILMSVSLQHETALRKELNLYGIWDHDVYRAVCNLITTHTNLPEGIVQVFYRTDPDVMGIGTVTRKYYSVSRDDFKQLYDTVLQPAYFVIENEKTNSCFMGARMMGQVYQTILPGQFFSYSGRYYEVQSITDAQGVVVRRASDHIDCRRQYRQIRKYTISSLHADATCTNLRGFSLQRMECRISVETNGYFDMESRGDFVNAHKVMLGNTVPVRNYHNKSILCITFPDTYKHVIFTACALLNELFVTLYPNLDGFLVATTNAMQGEDDIQRAIVPDLNCEGENAMYILEDCYMDLGGIISVERNFRRIMEIVADYLDWYLDERRERHAAAENELTNMDSHSSKVAQMVSAEKAIRSNASVSGEVPGQDVQGEDDEIVDSLLPPESSLREFLTYGGEEDAPFLALQELLLYLKEHRFMQSALHRTRKMDPELEEYVRHLEAGEHICDFCGAVMEPNEYEKLRDGRERCPVCSQNAVRKVKDVRKLFFETRAEMERIFGITIQTPIKIRVVNAKKIAAEFGEEFSATRKFDSRAVGFARQGRQGVHDLYLENGAPRDSLKSTIVHELTHIWQYENWSEGHTVSDYREKSELYVYEGMAVWTEIQMMLCCGETERAMRYEYNRLRCNDEYGNGLREYEKKYPFYKGDSVSLQKTPFGHIPPL